MKYLKLLFLICVLLPFRVHAQDNDVRIGADFSQFKQVNGALYDFSDPDKINIKVAIWGYVRFPGKYIVPINTSVTDIISYAGGPTDAAHLDDLRLFRLKEDSTTYNVYKFNFNEILYKNEEGEKLILPPPLKPSDIIVLPGEPRMYFRDKVSLTVTVVSAVTSLAILILNIVRK